MSTRQAAFAGVLYPADPHDLSFLLQGLLSRSVKSKLKPRVIIVPHGGYQHSGQVAAAAYASLENVKEHIKYVLLLGPVHSGSLTGCGLPAVSEFATPLGAVPVSVNSYEELSRIKGVVMADSAHKTEPSLEMQLPFLQTCLPTFKLLPLLVGQTDPALIVGILDWFWHRDDLLIVVSSDLSHYRNQAEAQRLDAETCRQILAYSTHIMPYQACGHLILNALLYQAKRRGLKIHEFGYQHSGESGGDRERVVGYASFVLYQGD
jgi:MEMO1 family protein